MVVVKLFRSQFVKKKNVIFFVINILCKMHIKVAKWPVFEMCFIGLNKIQQSIDIGIGFE